MMRTRTATPRTSLRHLAAISLFILGLLGVVMSVVNLNQTPADTGLTLVTFQGGR